jgi:micrococcal nuclease
MKKNFIFIILFSTASFSQVEKEAICIEKSYDGDTINLIFHIGEGVYLKKNCRLMGVNTPEKATKNALEKQAGIIVRDYLTSKTYLKKFKIMVYEDVNEKFGRLLIDIIIEGESINNEMVALGYAKPYFGEKKTEWTEKELNCIIK